MEHLCNCCAGEICGQLTISNFIELVRQAGRKEGKKSEILLIDKKECYTRVTQAIKNTNLVTIANNFFLLIVNNKKQGIE